MARRLHLSDSKVARVRVWFGLTMAELALYLRVSPALVQGIETDQRSLTSNVKAALWPLLVQLPPSEEQAEAYNQGRAEAYLPADQPAGVPGPPLPAGVPLPDAADLDFRRRSARAQAGRLLREAAALGLRARIAARWAEALPALLAAHPDPDDPAHTAHYAALAAFGTPPTTTPDPEALTDVRDHARWARGWLASRARPLPPEAITRYYRLHAQAAGLLAEASALAAVLPPVAGE